MAVVESNGVEQSESEVVMSRPNDNSFEQEKKVMTNGVLNNHEHHEDEGFKKEMRDLEDILSKLNPMAEEFVPPSLSNKSYNRGVLHSPPAAVDGSNINGVSNGRSDDEREKCARTIYCTNIDRKVTQADVKLFFESFCGEVNRLRLLGDYQHSSRIAFVEFVMAESAIAALNCSGAILGSLPIRVSPSKTPVRPRSGRPLP
ncbi:hypothetical protein M8C21_012886 [Ambrosia artemisiifolia]|uniref:RRM domain-containing protein n=1 Tax=Ambrosia artemisiifolia TaxID=4212 RepID=A0AAD5BU05_AMBAR|nr:hypothetical protein M8C21_012886 [Ambrosia artemisiifolia]